MLGAKIGCAEETAHGDETLARRCGSFVVDIPVRDASHRLRRVIYCASTLSLPFSSILQTIVRTLPPSTATLLLLLTLPLAAQPVDTVRHRPGPIVLRAGVTGAYGFNRHETDATVFTGGAECGAFRDGTGTGVAFGVLLERPVLVNQLDSMLDVSLQAAWVERGGTFGDVTAGGLPILDPTTGRYTELVRRHTYTAGLPTVQIEPGVRVRPLLPFSLPLYIRLAAAVGVPVGSSHEQNEEIQQPGGVVYPETNTRERPVSSGQIADVGLSFGVGGSIGYELPIGTDLTLAPEVGYIHPLSDVTPNARWRIARAQAGVAIRYSFRESIADTSTPPPPLATADPDPPNVVIAGAGSQRLTLVETMVTETFPVLPYIFFDSSSTALRDVYARHRPASPASFRESDLPRRSLESYEELLNVIGSRMAALPGSTITLNGTTDGREEQVAGTVDNLARGRAQTIKSYLTDTWGIDPKRIAITTSTRPAMPSSIVYAEGYEENRRVEITSNDDRLLAPVLFERFPERSVEPKQITFTTSAASPDGVKDWWVTVSAGNTPVWEQRGSGPPPSQLTWTLDDAAATRLAAALHGGDEQLRVQMRATSGRGRTGTAEDAQPANKQESPFEISRLSLIVFDFDKATINSQNRRMISTFVAQSLKPESNAEITGSTDRLGEMRYNEQLSQARAEAVRDLITAERPRATITKVQGIGPSRLLYDNSRPEGRYYCRTVTVEVRTPTAPR